MSRIGKQHLKIPEKVTVALEGATVVVSGPLGKLSRPFDNSIIGINIADGEVTFEKKVDTKLSRALFGTYASHVKNMIQGVGTPFVKKLVLEGVGFKSEVAGKNLNLALGFSHPVSIAIPEGLTVTAEKNLITVSGINKDDVGSFAAYIRSLKKPEPYKGKGFHYEDEVVRRKQGKKSA